MKKLLLLFALIALNAVSFAQDRTAVMRSGYTMLSRPMAFTAADSIVTSDSLVISITNVQKYMQHQTVTTTLTDVDEGSPSVVITLRGRVNSTDDWHPIGTAVTWTGEDASNPATITSTSPVNYNYLKVSYVASGATQHLQVATFDIHTANAYDIPANSGTLTVSRATEGTVTITSADDNANAALTVGAGGTGALTLGDAGSTTAITSSDWAIGATGAMTGIGAITADGLITANAGVTLGAGDDLIGSSTSDITFNTDKFTVAGATGNTVIAGTLGVSGLYTGARTTTTDDYQDMISTEWTAGAAMAAGGSNGIYSISNPVKDLANAYALRGRMDLRDATADVDVNQLHAIDGLINFNTSKVYDIVDNLSVVGTAVHGAGADITNVGGDGSLNLFYGAWGPTATQNFTITTNGILLLSHAGTYLDYGLNVENSGAMTAGILLNNHASNSPATMTTGIKMISAASKMTNGIDMSEASITGSDIVFQNSETITNSTDGTVAVSGVLSANLRGATVVVNTDESETLTAAQSGAFVTFDGAGTATIPNPSAATIGVIYYLLQTADANLIVTCTTADNNAFVCNGVATSDAITISTASHKIGAGMIVIGISATKWYVGGLNPESLLTPEAAD